ncbi:MAG: thioredoxin family protein [Verrucomicrobia bacterium]|nr:thioredoxin family protein [Verrucomicrobiota bacterium]
MNRWLLTIFLASAVAAQATGSEWLTDFEEAKRVAAETGRPILVDFSGSDWCGWCIRLEKEVFSQAAFSTYAKDNVVLFLADFPSQEEQPAATVKQNEALQQKYGIRGFPSVLLLDAEGNVLAETGYQPGGAERYVNHLKALIAKPAPTKAGKGSGTR